jgi:hypothetical protein
MFGKLIRRWAIVGVAALVAACGQSAAPEGPAKGEWHAFTASWSSSGLRYSLDFGPEHPTSIFKLSGTLLVSDGRKLGVGFRAEAIGFAEREGGMVGSSVWTGEGGDQIFSMLKGETIGTDKQIVGTFVGGTGRYAGAAGEYEFQWQYVISAEKGEISGRAVNLKGRIRVGEPAANSPESKGKP